MEPSWGTTDIDSSGKGRQKNNNTKLLFQIRKTKTKNKTQHNLLLCQHRKNKCSITMLYDDLKQSGTIANALPTHQTIVQINCRPLSNHRLTEQFTKNGKYSPQRFLIESEYYRYNWLQITKVCGVWFYAEKMENCFRCLSKQMPH